MKNTLIFISFLIVFNANNVVVAQSCKGLVYNDEFSGVKASNIKQIPPIIIPAKFQIEGGFEYQNGIEILSAGANGLVICSPVDAGIYSSEANTYSGYFSNSQFSSVATVQIAHGDDSKMDLQLEGVGRTAGEDGYVVNIDTDEDGDESFLVTDGGGTNLFRVRESDGTFTKNLGVQGNAKINEYLSINSEQNANAYLSLKRGDIGPVGSGNLISLDGVTEAWIVYIDFLSGDLCFSPESAPNNEHCFSNNANARSTDLKNKNISVNNVTKISELLERIETLELEITKIKG